MIKENKELELFNIIYSKKRKNIMWEKTNIFKSMLGDYYV